MANYTAEFTVRFNVSLLSELHEIEDLLRPDKIAFAGLLSCQAQRHVGQQLTLTYDRKELILTVPLFCIYETISERRSLAHTYGCWTGVYGATRSEQADGA